GVDEQLRWYVQVLHELGPRIGGPADLVAADGLAVEAPRPQVAPGRGSVGPFEQTLVIPRDRLGHRLHQPSPLLAALALVAVGVPEGDARLVGQLLDRTHEVDVFDL